MDGGDRTHDPKTHVLPSTPFVKVLGGTSPFDHLQKVIRWLTRTKPYNNQVLLGEVPCEINGGGHRVPPAGLPIEQVLGEYSLSFLRRDVALFVSTRARHSF